MIDTNILIFTTAIEHTTFRKTARMLTAAGAKVHVMGFTRNNYPFIDDGLSTESLGALEHGNYLKRLFVLLGFMLKLRSRAKNYDIVYTFTLDTLFISSIALAFMGIKFVYQIQDIRPVFFKNSLKGKVIRMLESGLLRKIKLLVVSSGDFYEGFYKKQYNFPENKVVVIENKLECLPTKTESKKRENSSIVIGYFGVMRCLRSWEILKSASTNKVNSIDVYLRGKNVAVPDLGAQCQFLSNVKYEGEYSSPQDLNMIYSKVDIVWAAYPYSETDDGNWRYARTIRFYEACAFRKPVIVQKGTPQAEDVEKYNIGLVIDMKDVEATAETLISLTAEQLTRWRDNISKMPISYYLHQEEYVLLLDRIKKTIDTK